MLIFFFFFFFNDTATTEIYTLSLHDALPISRSRLMPTIQAPQQPASAKRHILDVEQASEISIRFLHRGASGGHIRANCFQTFHANFLTISLPHLHKSDKRLIRNAVPCGGQIIRVLYNFGQTGLELADNCLKSTSYSSDFLRTH